LLENPDELSFWYLCPYDTSYNCHLAVEYQKKDGTWAPVAGSPFSTPAKTWTKVTVDLGRYGIDTRIKFKKPENEEIGYHYIDDVTVTDHFTPATLEIHCINVGQGSSELIIGPDGTSILIDAGKDAYGTTVRNFVQSRGVYALDYVLITHNDSDHVGGIDKVILGSYDSIALDVKQAIFHDGEERSGNRDYDQFLSAAIQTSAGKLTQIEPGIAIGLGNGARALCVASHGDVIDGSRFSASDRNDRSPAILIEYRDFDYITAGDLTDGEYDVANALRTYPSKSYSFLSSEGVDIIHCNHHGSRYSTLPSYVNLLKPNVACINVGNNSYGHPTQEAIDRLLARSWGITVPAVQAVYQTAGPQRNGSAVVGNISITYDGRTTYYVNDTAYAVDESGTIPIPVATITPIPSDQPPPRRDPALHVYPSAEEISPGDPFSLEVEIEPMYAAFDAWALVIMPNQKRLFISSVNSLSKTPDPLVKGIPWLPNGYSIKLLSFAALPPIPVGTYKFVVGFIPPGSQPKRSNAFMLGEAETVRK
jgi:beta-lactamase superfamily II metal-dependent hydrolase